ncbi:MAG: polysaccharide deacetylase family protein [Vicinamibacteraceae bacterium]
MTTATAASTSGPSAPRAAQGRSGTAPTAARVRRARLVYGLKLIVAYVLYYTGVLRLYQLIAMRQRAVVLMYHRVLTADERAKTASHPALVVDAATFATQMSLLSRCFTVIGVDELADRMARGEPLRSRSCLITFDDGWRDNYLNALPVLQRHRLPALVFLPVNFIGKRRLFWQEALTHALMRVVGEVMRVPAHRAAFAPLLAPFGLTRVLDIDAVDPRPYVIDAITTQKGIEPAVVDRLVRDIDAALAAGGAPAAVDPTIVDGFMDWPEVDEMGRAGVAFGGHGAEHRLLTYVSPGEVESEIRESKAVVDARFAATAPTFSYPNGYLTPEIAARVESAGYRLAFSTTRGFVAAGDDRFAVRRLNIHESVTNTGPLFFAKVLGVL